MRLSPIRTRGLLVTGQARRSTFRAADVAEEMAHRIQALQTVYEPTLPANQPYVLRLDGVAFRNYTAGMRKPFDPRLTRAMNLTTRDLMERCAARTGYCQSDEISLVFAPETTPMQIMYAGRVQKIASVMASWAAARFNWHISQVDWSDVDEMVRRRAASGLAVFDARVFATPDDIMAAEAIYWRHAFDGRRNAINMIACSVMSHKQMQGLPLAVLIDRLRSAHNIDPFSTHPPTAIYGAFFKKRLVPHVGFNPLTGQSVPTLRARVEARSFDWSRAEELQRAALVMAKTWEENTHPGTLEIIDLDSSE